MGSYLLETQGLLPPVLLAVLMMLLPIVLRLFAKFQGIPKKTGLELSLMTRFFIFQVIVRILLPALAIALSPVIDTYTQIALLLDCHT